MNITFENKVTLITGAGSGLGLATAKTFAESGASVVLVDWNEKAARSAAEELADQGHKTLTVCCDVSDDDQVEQMVEQAVSTSDETKDANKIELSRRNLLKIVVAGLLAGVAAPLFPHLSSTYAAATGTDREKVLIVYYSRSGNTREIANQIHRSVGGDIFEIQVVEPYPEDYEAVKERAMRELNSGFKPALKTKAGNIGSYNVIFVGTPIWWGTISAPVKSFLSAYNLSGKTIVPFITHQGSGLGQSVTDISKLCPSSTLLDGIAIWGRNVKTAQGEVSEWLQKIKIKK